MQTTYASVGQLQQSSGCRITIHLQGRQLVATRYIVKSSQMVKLYMPSRMRHPTCTCYGGMIHPTTARVCWRAMCYHSGNVQAADRIMLAVGTIRKTLVATNHALCNWHRTSDKLYSGFRVPRRRILTQTPQFPLLHLLAVNV